MMTKIQTVAKTHVGQVRDHNEDTFIVGLDPVSDSWVLNLDEHELGEKGAVFVVADGMGGENAGEIASEIAVQSIRAYIRSELTKEPPQSILKILESSLVYAHNCIKDACRDNADYIGMGTTATVCFLTNDQIYLSWIGDTRVYRYSQHGRVHALPYHYNNLEILSEDHSKVWQMMQQGQISLEEARIHEQSNIITQSLGDLFRTPQPESREYPLFKDDYILICSDGLNGMISDEALERIFTSEYESFDKMADQMILEANLAGGHDNITLIMTKVMEGIPYSEDILKKGTGEKTLKTQVFTKDKTFIWKDILIAAIVAMGLLYAWQKRLEVYNYFSNLEPAKVAPNIINPEADTIPVVTPLVNPTLDIKSIETKIGTGDVTSPMTKEKKPEVNPADKKKSKTEDSVIQQDSSLRKEN